MIVKLACIRSQIHGAVVPGLLVTRGEGGQDLISLAEAACFPSRCAVRESKEDPRAAVHEPHCRESAKICLGGPDLMVNGVGKNRNLTRFIVYTGKMDTKIHFPLLHVPYPDGAGLETVRSGCSD